MNSNSCPECHGDGEVISDEIIEEDGKKFSEKILGCHECGHSWTTRTKIKE